MIADPTPVEDLLRNLAPQVLGTLTRQSGDFDAAEDAVQEALIAAADHWPREGIPEYPRAWLLRTAGRRLVDQRRSEQARANRELQVGLDSAAAQPTASDEDDTLAVLFMCCHPSLTPASAIALTLRAVGGLTTPQIARAFLVPEVDDGPADLAGEADDQGVRRPVPHPDRRRATGRRFEASSTSST